MKKKISGIYKITNLINGKIYIGQSVDIEKRFSDHKYASNWKNAQDYNSPIHRAFRKYGIENFSLEIIEEIPPINDELNSKEIFYISFYDSTNSSIGYNILPGGKVPDGEDNPNAKLTNAQVFELRNLYFEGYSQREAYEEMKRNYPDLSVTIGSFSAVWLGNCFNGVNQAVYDKSLKPLILAKRFVRLHNMTIDDVKNIRNRKNMGERFQKVYSDYKNKIGVKPFREIWDNNCCQAIQSELPDNSFHRSIPVVRINKLDQNDIKIYPSIRRAVADLKITWDGSTKINNACRTGAEYLGYYWKYKD